MTQTQQAADPQSINLPDRDFEWGDNSTVDSGATLVPNAERVRFPASDRASYLPANSVAYIPEGADTYLAEHGDRELSVPPTYTSMDEFEGYIGSATARGHGFGLGFDPARLEAGIRVATGGGRYSADEITVIACGGIGAVFRGPDGDFVVSSKQVPAFESDDAHAYPTYSVAGIDIPEEDETIREGIREFVPIFSEIEDTDITDHESISGPKHYFATSGGETVRISGRDLATLSGMERDRDAILGTAMWDRDHSPHTFKTRVDEGDLEYAIGDEYLGRVIGYRLNWQSDRHGRYSRQSGLRRVRLEAEYVRYSNSGGHVRIDTTTRNIQTWEL